MISTLLETASVDGLDPSCIEATPPTEFRIPNDHYRSRRAA